MDSEKNAHMRELLEEGRPVTDEGPYYHHAWWESYKGGVKGKLGGGVLGAGIGAATGLLAAGAAIFFAPAGLAIGAGMVGITVAGFAGAGMLYGVHEFADVGKVTGAVASTQKTAERRMKAFEDSKFDEIKEDINELKAIVKGEPVPERTAEARTAALLAEQEDYRTDHFQGNSPETDTPIFWKVALVGLVIGVMAGAILAGGGFTGEILHALGVGGTSGGLGAAGLGEYLVSMASMGAIGASFGINRDIFRQTFDTTDLGFRGFVSHQHSRNVLLGKDKQVEHMVQTAHDIERTAPAVPPSPIDYPESGTYHQDKYAAAKQALQSMDIASLRPH